jgi:hypothetical protein
MIHKMPSSDTPTSPLSPITPTTKATNEDGYFDSPFSSYFSEPDEYRTQDIARVRVVQRLGDITNAVSNNQLDTEQLEKIASKLDYLESIVAEPQITTGEDIFASDKAADSFEKFADVCKSKIRQHLTEVENVMQEFYSQSIVFNNRASDMVGDSNGMFQENNRLAKELDIAQKSVGKANGEIDILKRLLTDAEAENERLKDALNEMQETKAALVHQSKATVTQFLLSMQDLESMILDNRYEEQQAHEVEKFLRNALVAEAARSCAMRQYVISALEKNQKPDSLGIWGYAKAIKNALGDAVYDVFGEIFASTTVV